MCMYEDFLLNQYKEKFLLNIVKDLTTVEFQHIYRSCTNVGVPYSGRNDIYMMAFTSLYHLFDFLLCHLCHWYRCVCVC
jgi:hypothetical protein